MKKGISPNVSNHFLDEMYSRIMSNGANGANGDNGEWQRMLTITAWSGRGGNDYAIDIWEAGKNNFDPKAAGVNNT